MSHDRRGEIPFTVTTMDQIAKAQADERAAKERAELLSWTAADFREIADEVGLKKKAEVDKAIDDELVKILKDVKKQSQAGLTSLSWSSIPTYKEELLQRLMQMGFRYDSTKNLLEWGDPKPPVYRGTHSR